MTARCAASFKRRLRSAASFSRLAFVLLDPDGATPVKIRLLSLGVKLTKPTAPFCELSLAPWKGGEALDLLRRCELDWLLDARRELVDDGTVGGWL